MRKLVIITMFVVIALGSLYAWHLFANELWRVTHYCACEKCCGKWSDGHFASGKPVYVGGVACNWLPFGTKLRITQGKIVTTYVVEDRGAKSIFGDKDNHKKALDIYCSTHNEAKQNGVKWLKVEVLK